jgi:2-polyprenyl-3-methyl-5-hydroxy-6-metoxy-1,4-benzoquinol methylase
MENSTFLTDEEMITLQAENHDLVKTVDFESVEEVVLHLRHSIAYAQAALLVTNKKVLDLGCNVGYGSNVLFKNAKSVVGVDVSEKAIQSAKNHYGHLGINFQQIDGKTLPFESDSFDIVVSFQVIEHIVDCSKFINEIKRITKPDGAVIFTTPNSLLRLDPGMKPWNKFHVREYNKIELESLLKNYFNKVDIYGLFANEPLYSIEVNRVAKAREKARDMKIEPFENKQNLIKATIKKILPQKIITLLKSTRNRNSNNTKTMLNNFIGKYTINDFYFKEGDLESALDFFTVCSDNAITLSDINSKIIK